MLNHIIDELEGNAAVFEGLFKGVPEAQYRWRRAPGKWCLLEVAAHLIDEEVEDFRSRVRHVLEHPGTPPPPIDPEGWVTARNYFARDYEAQIATFLAERKASIAWLRGLGEVDWSLSYDHQHFGRMTAWYFLVNWLAHDHLHIRQITAIKFAYLKAHGESSLEYAGDW